MNVSEEIKKYNFLQQAAELTGKMNVKTFIVGGFVRDLILKKECKDIDFLIIGDVMTYAQTFANQLGIKDIVVYRTFGTAHFVYDGINFEFVAARKESYKRSSRKPEVTDGTFLDDISRRDFTINTLAVSIMKDNFGDVIDQFNGLSDIENKIIRTPIDPKITFDDDPLRILRAFRFASQLNFIVDDSVMQAAEEFRERLEIVSQERKTDEFLKILKSPKPSIGLNLLQQSKVMEVIFPEISVMIGVEQRKDYHHKDVFYHTLEVVDNISLRTDDVWLRFSALVHDIAKPKTKKFVEGIGWTFHGHEEIGARMMRSIFKRMKLPFNKLEYIEKLIRLHLRPIALVKDDVTDSAIRRLVVAADENLEDLITLCRADITSKNPEKVERYLQNYEIVMKKVLEVQEKDKLRAFQSPVSGEVIMQVCKIKPSKKVGEIKTAIEEAILDGIIANNYEEAYEYLLKIKEDFL
ncbi:MAG: HD domain-containing protein [Ignavibacteriota bacterium]|nr:MAG: HD domain-containing protein [Chlorobiota bacterium]MBE7478198.1 HD domain-containing protein [Ignavibacteriales bacterium]MBL1121572.1 HD domain-containing protein [Ignavibacteriota bacterium]MCC7093614.1 HD domain-containing protein [Ignavibacteriaceae bacterium]MCE7855244.1 HD domain-containing protein [Ignavibacteria bacterium CHB3]MEB2296095.1 CCA tRNA nucleotidyltransferase [Ignavibacteria bacterium]